MAVISKDLGAVTAYAAAVNRGYTGTKEEFEILMASYATVAQQAAQSATTAEQYSEIAQTAAGSAESAMSTAQQSATAAQTASTSAQGYAQSAQTNATSAQEYAQIAESVKDTAVDAVDGFAAGAQQALDSVNQAGNNWKSLAEAEKLDSEAWAVGKRDGSDVGVSDPTYHNNAKYYAESVSADAQTATTKAGEAAQSAASAQESAAEAAESARTLTIDPTLTQSGQAADSKVVGDKIGATTEEFTEYDSTDITSTLTIEAGQVNESTGAISGTSSYSHTNKIAVESGYKITTSRVFRRIAAYNGDTLMPSSGTGTSGSEYVVPSDVDGIIISFANSANPFNVTLGIPRTEYDFKYINEINTVRQMQKQINISSDNPNANVGENISSALTEWTAIGSAEYSDGAWALHSANDGVTIPLISNAEAGEHYLIELTFVPGSVSNGVDKINQLTFALGDDDISIFCANDGNFNVVLSPSEDASSLTIVGSGDSFAISISSVTVKKVLSFPDAFMIANINQFRTSGSNFGFGFGHRYMAKGVNNVALGARAQEYLDTGIWNTAIGNNAQRRIRNGIGNSAFGNTAEVNITNGCYNNAFGTSALANITSGCWNNGFGNETLRDTTTGHNNIAFGRRAMNSLIDGCANIAIGAQAGFYPNPSVHDNNNIFIGIKACRKATSATTSNDKAIAIGAYAKAGSNGIAIGSANADESPLVADDNQIKIGNTSHTSVVIAGKTITFNPDGTVTWS